MLFLANFILKGQSQAALTSAGFAVLGLLFPPAAWLSAAAIVLVTLVHGQQRGLLTMVFALLGSALFLWLLFSTPQVALIFVLMSWLPAWLVSIVLRKTVSLAYSLQILTAIGLIVVGFIYWLYPDIGEFWRAPLTLMLDTLITQTANFGEAGYTATDIKTLEDTFIAFIPGLFVASVISGTMISLFIARWWQSVIYNSGGFAKEFYALALGKVSTIIALLILLLGVALVNVFAYSLIILVVVLYLVQSLALLHAIINQRKMNRYWTVLIYLILFFIPQVLLVLVLMGLVDPWLDFRTRFSQTVSDK